MWIIATESYRQSHYREVLRWEIFMEQELRFGLDLGRLAVLKEKGLGPLWATFEGGFFKFSGAFALKKTFQRRY